MKKIIICTCLLFVSVCVWAISNITLYRDNWKIKFMDNVFYEKSIDKDGNIDTKGEYRKVVGTDIYDKNNVLIGSVKIVKGYVTITYFYLDSENKIAGTREVTEFFGRTGRAIKMTVYNEDGKLQSVCDYKERTLTVFDSEGNVESTVNF
ncbi:MAG: hypothetical protein K6F69_05535 [Treponema sp.]|nr:hypothetical protein [Treponema sp.]